MDGARIRILLQHSNATASQLARHCQVSAQAVCNWIKEESASKPREEKLDLIAEFFGISRQQLEFGPLMCISPPDIPFKNLGNLNVKMSISAADMMISKELDGSPRSPEFKSGMRDRIVHKLSGVSIHSEFKAGSCQYDAYMAGRAQAETIISKL